MNPGDPARPFPRQERVTIGVLLLILLLAAGLRFCRLGAQSLWNDEGTSVAMAQRDLPTIAQDAAHDIHPPLYYWLLSGWVRLAGASEAAVRSLSALLGVVLVTLTYLLGRILAGRWVGLLAAFLAAINPFQVYYSQEARMYMLAAVLAAGAVLALIFTLRSQSWPALAVLVVAETAGLYTHYSFVFVILALNLACVLWLWLVRRQERVARSLGIWAASQLLVVLLYLPWLPVALRQVTTWPSPTVTVPPLTALADTWCCLAFGPTIEAGQVVVPLLMTGALAVLGVLALAGGNGGPPPPSRGEPTCPPRLWGAGLLVLWLGLPVILMLLLGLYREAYLKFLLVTAPAMSLLLSCGLLAPFPGAPAAPEAAAPHPLLAVRPGAAAEGTKHATRDTLHAPRHTPHAPPLTFYTLRLFQIAAAITLVAVSGIALCGYYTDTAHARDDYRSIAAYIDAVGRPGDAILLNAPGQQEVFRYYYRGGLPLYPLPENRPLDPAATEAALEELTRSGSRVFALLWATDESDPARFVEGWLDNHAYKTLDAWYGNVRLVLYAMPRQVPAAAQQPEHTMDIPLKNSETGDEIVLLGYSLLSDRLAAGDIAPITLFWRADQTPSRRYKVFLHVLDPSNQIVGQRDAEPGGGARLTTLWAPGDVVADNYGIPIHPATPPGEYRIEVGMYDPETGQRLLTPDGATQVWLAPLQVQQPVAPAPVGALGMGHPGGADFGELTLLGYDAHKLGFADQPELALQPGDVLHVNLYWRADAQPSDDWQVLLSLVDRGERVWAEVGAEPVGSYPTHLWQTGDVWRGQFNLAVPADAPSGQYRLRVQPQTPGSTWPDPFVSDPLPLRSGGTSGGGAAVGVRPWACGGHAVAMRTGMPPSNAQEGTCAYPSS